MHSKELEINKIPRHVAVIMDGNGRWAELNGLDRIFGHREGVEAVRSVVEGLERLEYNILHFMLFLLRTGIGPKRRWRR